jgi:hypothetical protein
MSRRARLAGLLLALAWVVPAAAQQAPAVAKPGQRPAARRDTSLAGIDTTGGKVEYRREVFHYGGGTRDPFQTLITSGGGVGPTINDLRLVSVIYDPRYGRSVAIVVETKGDVMHRLHRGDAVGRLRVLQIRQYEVVFQIEEFGFERQVVLTLQRQGEANP